MLHASAIFKGGDIQNFWEGGGGELSILWGDLIQDCYSQGEKGLFLTDQGKSGNVREFCKKSGKFSEFL